MKQIFGTILLLTSLLIDAPLASAQIVEVEPNDPCSQAQYLGVIPVPYSLSGSLDSTPENSDVDFFRFNGLPGALVRIGLEGAATGQGTLPDPYLGAFDSSCNQIASDDDNGVGFNSELQLTIPPDGVVTVGATSCCDVGFLGGGVGTYRLSVDRIAVIGSISGRIVDAVTAEPLSGSAGPPFAFVRLLRCENTVCFDVAGQPAGSDGRFQFSGATQGQSLSPGNYQVIAGANEYEFGQTDPIEVLEGEDRILGDVALQPFPVRFSDITPCSDVPAEGGTCRYSVRITNRLATRLAGVPWSLVTSLGTGSLTDFTRFQVNIPRKLVFRSLESKVIQFKFDVPNTVRAGAQICTEVFFGDDRREPFFNTVGNSSLFCISKSFGPLLSVVPSKDAQKIFRRSDSRIMAPPRVRSR